MSENQEFTALHPQANTKPKEFTVAPKRAGGRLGSQCGCGWYCMHNHKEMEQAVKCAKRHADSVGG